MSQESRRALFKLQSLGIDVDEPLIGSAPSIRVREQAFDALQAAVGSTIVSFAYLKPGETVPRLRTVRPLALVQFGDRWHLYSHDLDADAPRNFLLARIVGTVKTGTAFEDVSGIDHQSIAVAELDALWRSRTAKVDVRVGSHAEGRLATVPDSERDGEHWTIHYLDAELFADELAGYGPEVVVIAPAELRAAVTSRLEAVIALHSGVDHG
jgi:proteasome accessory factor B